MEARAEASMRDLRDVSLAGFMSQQAASWPFVVYPWMPRRLVTLLGGHGGAGKSMLILIMLAHAACGRSWAGVHFDPCRCLYVSLEDSGDLVRYRLKRICEAYGLDPDAIERNLRVLDVVDGDSSLVTEVNDQGVRRLFPTGRWTELADLAQDVDWIAIDNASDAFDGNENERRQVRTFIRKLAELATEHDAALTLLAHIDKRAAINGSSGNSYSGSTAWHNSARSRLALTKNDDGSVTLTQEKLNLGRESDPITLRWNDEGVLMPADPGASDSGSTITQQREDGEAALHALQSAAKAGLTVAAATSGSSTAWHSLEPLPDLPAVFKGKDGRRRLHGALLRLSGEGLIERERYQAASRNYRERWALTKAGENLANILRARESPIPPPRTHERGRFVVSAEEGSLTNDSRTHEGMAATAYRAARDGDL